MNIVSALFFVVVNVAVARSRDVAPNVETDSNPTVVLSLDPPPEPLQEVWHKIGDLENSRETSESAMMRRVNHEAQHALTSTKAKISSMVSRFMHAFDEKALGAALAKQGVKPSPQSSKVAFFETSATKNSELSGVTVHVGRVAPLDSEPITNRITDVEGTRAKREEVLVEQAIEEIRSFPALVASELEELLQTQVFHNFHKKTLGFLQAQAEIKVNVEVVPSESFPSVRSLLQEMQQRSSIAESLISWEIIAVKLKLLQSVNSAVKNAFEGAVSHIMSH